MRIILDGPVEHSEWALGLVNENLKYFELVSIGSGWGFTTTDKPNVSAFLRRTKSGASVKVWVNDNVHR